MENFKSIFELIRSEQFRRRPAMFLGKLSILSLAAYIEGYRMALWIHKIDESDNLFNATKFNDFVANHYNRPAEAGWMNNIWAENYGDEAQSFKTFFILFDEFIKEKKDYNFYYHLMSLYTGKLNQNELRFEDYKILK